MHEAPLVLQRSHWYENAVGEFDQVPFDAVNVCPTCGVPVTVGGAVLTGAALLAACPAPARSATSTSAAAKTDPIPAVFQVFIALLRYRYDLFRIPNR